MVDISNIEKIEYWTVWVEGETIKFPTYKYAINFKKAIKKRKHKEVVKQLRDYYPHTVFEKEIEKNRGEVL